MSRSVADQPPRRLGYDDPAGVRQALQPRREIGGVADDGLFLRGPLSDDVADHHEAGGDADPRRDFFARRGLEARHDLDEF
jgi:hypothetical protein